DAPVPEMTVEPLEPLADPPVQLHPPLVVTHPAAHREAHALQLTDQLLELVDGLFTQDGVHLDLKMRVPPQRRQLPPEWLQPLVREVRRVDAVNGYAHGVQAGAVQRSDQLVAQQQTVGDDVRPAALALRICDEVRDPRVQERLSAQEVHDRHAQHVHQVVHATHQ